MSSNIFFSNEKFLFEINKGLFNWFFQLKKEKCFLSLKNYPFSKYFYLNNIIYTQVIFIFDELSENNCKKFKSNIFKKSIGFSWLKNDINWNNTMSISELSLDISLQLLSSNKNINSSLLYKWKWSIQLVLFYYLNSQNYSFLNTESKRNIKSRTFFFERILQKFYYTGWYNVIFDNLTFFKKKTSYNFNKQVSDASQNIKVLQFLLIKKCW